MNEDRNFVARWSRLKREGGKGQITEDRRDVAAEGAGKHETADPAERGQIGEPEEAFDVSKLPPIDSIAAGTDIRAFLQKGVPAALTRAALRRAWSADPAIRDFIGIAENQWDFTDPTAIPGFGPLQAGDNLQDLVSQAMGKLHDHTTGPTDVSEPDAVADSGLSPGDATASHKEERLELDARDADRVEARADLDQERVRSTENLQDDTAPQHERPAAQLRRRKHGRALPNRY
jgi:hypothetical protein